MFSSVDTEVLSLGLHVHLEGLSTTEGDAGSGSSSFPIHCHSEQLRNLTSIRSEHTVFLTLCCPIVVVFFLFSLSFSHSPTQEHHSCFHINTNFTLLSKLHIQLQAHLTESILFSLPTPNSDSAANMLLFVAWSTRAHLDGVSTMSCSFALLALTEQVPISSSAHWE